MSLDFEKETPALSKDMLELLFYKRESEVKGEETVNFARTGFASHQNPRRKEFQNEQLKQSGGSSTASALVSLQNPAFSEKKICGFIPRIENDEILNELKRKKIVFADFFREETDINLLIGADVLGKLLTGNTVVLECGLTAVETKLGWTVFGKGSCRIDNILPSLSMHSMSLPANKLWELEVLGIASENEKEKDDFNLKDFNDKIKILPDGRYETLSSCIGARLVNSVIRALGVASIKVTLWSDSTVALWWIKECGEWLVFVANRVKEIRGLTGCFSW
ncbi:uncharacterized protein NPIL_380081 [Nephila pilipes]|uniref:Peptidase aspartic putative domain-containing protein n=1 Tax=Nephila pilipes TaxID=299642 RepID=A0A8X6Q1L9_NEPPI|nr:uncharacterized protein NPIL_380081 [Nephila pilipes]